MKACDGCRDMVDEISFISPSLKNSIRHFEKRRHSPVHTLDFWVWLTNEPVCHWPALHNRHESRGDGGKIWGTYARNLFGPMDEDFKAYYPSRLSRGTIAMKLQEQLTQPNLTPEQDAVVGGSCRSSSIPRRTSTTTYKMHVPIRVTTL